jgi:hypothetical protein
MKENGPTKTASATIEIVSIYISPCLIIVLCLLGSNAPCLLVLTDWSLPNPMLAIAYKPAGRVRSNYKLKYLTMYRSNLLQIYATVNKRRGKTSCSVSGVCL